MYLAFKSYIPSNIKSLIKKYKIIKIINKVRKKKVVNRMSKKHKKWLNELKNKKQLKVVFLVIHKSIWKVDNVYKKMRADPYFETEILVCPYMTYGDARMLEEMNQAYEYFKSKGYFVRKSIRQDGSWISLEEINPDIVFFTNPNNLTRKEYYEHAYSNYLSCYVPYYFMATNHAGDKADLLNTCMLNSMWRIYWPHHFVYEQFKRYSEISGSNACMTGYPAVEKVLDNDASDISHSTWKPQPINKKKIIYAPHHTISDDKTSLSTFLKYGNFFKELAKTYKGAVQWSFKPHPILKPKLYQHPDWGRQKTDEYYSFWDSQEFTQFDDGDYDVLFIESDAMIHDCSSFIVEYAFTKKPVLYLFNEDVSALSFLNEFGQEIFKTHKRASNKKNIIEFIDRVVDGGYPVEDTMSPYFYEYLSGFYDKSLPSSKIIDDIKLQIKCPGF